MYLYLYFNPQTSTHSEADLHVQLTPIRQDISKSACRSLTKRCSLTNKHHLSLLPGCVDAVSFLAKQPRQI